MLSNITENIEFMDSTSHQWSENFDSCEYGIDEISKILKRCRKKQFSAKEVIYHGGGSVDTVFVILGGMVKLLNYLPNGRARIVRLHGDSQWIGLEGLLGSPYQHTAIAIEDVEVVCVPVKKIYQLEHNNMQQYNYIVKQGYKTLAQADRWIADFFTGGIKARVARLIYFLSNLEFGKASNFVRLITVHEMADMLGVTPESVSRTLAQFKRNNILKNLTNMPPDIYQIDRPGLEQSAQK